MLLTVILNGPQVSNVNIEDEVNTGQFFFDITEKEEKKRLFK